MKKPGLLSVLIVASTLFLPACGEQKKLKEISSHVDAAVRQIKGGDRQAAEYAEVRKINFLDFDRDGTKDAIVFFTIEGSGGGDNYSFYMLALRAKDDGFVQAGTIRVGAKGERHVNFDAVRLEHGAVVIETTEYGPEDAMCCPSKPATAKFEIINGNIRELAK